MKKCPDIYKCFISANRVTSLGVASPVYDVSDAFLPSLMVFWELQVCFSMHHTERRRFDGLDPSNHGFFMFGCDRSMRKEQNQNFLHPH